jgi:SSS family solute:Na+ symporter
MPIIVVLPGMAFVLYQNGHFGAEMLQDGSVNPDRLSCVVKFVASRFKGLSFAALTAAIVASLAGKANSIATILH